MRSIVSGVNQDQQSRQVLNRALAEAQTTGRPLEVLHAAVTPAWALGAVGLQDSGGVQAGSTEARQVADDLLGDALGARSEASLLPISVQGRFGDAGDLLVRASVDAGLVVVGARSHGPVLSAVWGSATGYVLQHASCPVMVVARSSASGPYRRVVLGYDNRDRAGSALRWALDAARRHRCPLVVVHALRLTPSPVRLSAQITDVSREDEVHAWLAAEVARCADVQVDVTTRVRDGDAVEVLLEEAGADDLLVLGSRAHAGLQELLLGAVAVDCAKHAFGVVVVVRAGQERLDNPSAGTAAAARHSPLAVAGQ